MAKKMSADLAEVHATALKRADEAWTFERTNVSEGREDQKFYAGDQWDEAAKKARGTDRPMLTVNRLGTFVRQVTGDIRQNTPAIKVLPARGKASQDKADMLNGMIRSIEAESDADACYEKAASNVAQAGQGAFRIVTDYVDDKGFDQDIRIRPIADPFGVLVDPMASLPDKSDMEYAYVFEHLSKEAFKAEYPDATAEDIPLAVGTDGMGFQWRKGESVRIAEYWCKEKTKRKLHLLAGGMTTDRLPPGVKAVSSRDVEDVRIVSYMISGKEVLSGPHAWAGKYIPICFVPGEEITIDGATRRKGVVRDAKDPQRLVNYARTVQAESTALQPKAPFVITKAQIKGYESIWKSAGTQPHPYLPYNSDGSTAPPQRSQPPVMSSGLSELSAMAGQDLHDVTGIYPAALGAKSNETSGIAIRARQHEADTGSNYVASNLKRAIAYAGRILVDLIPKIYDSQRIVRILKEDGSHEMQTINAQMPNGMIDPATELDDGGGYDVVVSTGPGYLTKQQEMADMIVELARNLPQVGQVAPDLLVKAMGFPGGDEIAKRLEKMLPPGMVGDEPPPPPKPDPVAAATALDKAASADLKQAQTAKTLMETGEIAQQVQALGADVQALMGMMKQFAEGQGAQGGGMPPMPPQAGGMPPPDMPPEAMPSQMQGDPMGMPPGGEDDGELIDIEPIEGEPTQ